MFQANPKADAIVDLMRDDFIEDFRSRMRAAERIRAGAVSAGACDTEALAEFRREIHSLKGTGGSFGFPSVSLICQRFEEYLDRIDASAFFESGEVTVFMDQLSEILESRRNIEGPALKKVMQSLPKRPY